MSLAQTITFNAFTIPFTYSNNITTLSLSASSDSNLTVSFASSDLSIATVDGTTLTILKAGTPINITASQAGNGTYSAATPVVRQLQILKGTPTFDAWATINKTYGDNSFALSSFAPTSPANYTSDGALTYTKIDGNNYATIASGVVTIVNAGDVTTIRATRAATDLWDSAYVETTLIIAKANQTISFGVISNLYYRNNYNYASGASTTSTSGLTISLSSNNNAVGVTGLTLNILSASSSTISITASLAGNTNYNAASDVIRTFSVLKGTPTFDTWTNITKTYGDSSFALSSFAPTSDADYTSDGALTYSKQDGNNYATIASGVVTINSAGTVTTIRATRAETTKWDSAYVETTLIINKANQTITFPVISNLYYRNNYNYASDASTTSNSGETLSLSSSNNDEVGVSGLNLNILSPSTSTINITASLPGNTNYNAATQVVRTFSVLKGTPTFDTWTNITKTYGDSSFALSLFAPTSDANYTSDGALTYSKQDLNNYATIVSGVVTIVSAGTVTTIRATRAETTKWNSAYVETTLIINKANQTISFDTLTNQTFLPSPNNVIVSLSASVTTGNTATPIVFISSNVNVGTISGTNLTLIGAGTTYITARATSNINYNETDLVRTQEVIKASQTITFDSGLDNNQTYAPSTTISLGATASSGLTISYSSNNAVLNISGSSAIINSAGSVRIYADQNGSNQNGYFNYFSATPVYRDLVINKANQTITFAALASVPYSTLGTISLSATSNSGLPVSFASSNIQGLTLSGTTLTIQGVSTSVITASQAGNVNYNAATDVLQTQTITKVADPICFNEGTYILCLNKNFKEEYVLVNNLKCGDIVKTYKHGYRKIELTTKSNLVNDPNKHSCCMYKIVKNSSNGLIEDLIVTGGHSILVNNIDKYKLENEKLLGGTIKIDDKYLLLAAVCPDFVKLENTDTYTYYHFILENNENDEERFGVWSNGILTETPSKKQFLQNI